MKLRGVDFGPCLDAAGLRGWAGEGYWFHHRLWGWLFYNFTGSTLVGKTLTLGYNKGNMELGGWHTNYAPKHRFPDCIKAWPARARTLNAVGLACPGADIILNKIQIKEVDDDHRGYKGPFMFSFMAVAKDELGRIMELKDFVILLRGWIQNNPGAWGRVGLQINISCPNTGLDTAHLVHESEAMLDKAGELNIPLMVKLNLLAPIEAAVEISEHPQCDAICMTNALPFGSLPERIDWERLYPNGSPLAKYGGGGYSGPELLPMVVEYICEAKAAGMKKPWNAGGGIRSAKDVYLLCCDAGLRPGVDSIFFASAALTHPWNIGGIIREAHNQLNGGL